MSKAILYTDGCYYMDAEVGGIGGYLVDENNYTLCEFSELIETKKLFNKHEYIAFKKGLKIAFDKGIKDIYCYTDAKHIATLFNEKIIPNSIKSDRLLHSIFKLAQKFNSINIEYLPREENKRADNLSRKLILERGLQKNLKNIEKPFFSEKFLFSAPFKELDKEEFKEKCKATQNYFIFETEVLAHEKYALKVFHIFYENQEVKILKQLRYDLSFTNELLKESLNIINDTLIANKEVKNCIVYFKKDIQKKLEITLKGKCEIPVSINQEIEKLKTTFDLFDFVIYHYEKSVMEKLYPLSEEDNKLISNKEYIEKLKNDIYNTLQSLSQNAYQSGHYPELETKYNFGNIDNYKLQKKYFGELVKLMGREMLGESAQLKKMTTVQAQVLMDKVKAEIKSKGIHLEF
jgi:ribonuclease HI